VATNTPVDLEIC